MTPAEAYDATRDAFAAILMAQARAQGIAIDVGQIYAMLDTAMTNAGMMPLLTVLASADVAASAYDGAYIPPEEGAPDLSAPVGTWKTQREILDTYPNLSGLIAV